MAETNPFATTTRRGRRYEDLYGLGGTVSMPQSVDTGIPSGGSTQTDTGIPTPGQSSGGYNWIYGQNPGWMGPDGRMYDYTNGQWTQRTSSTVPTMSQAP